MLYSTDLPLRTFNYLQMFTKKIIIKKICFSNNNP